MSNGKVLIIDDEASIRDVARAYLEHEGFDVASSADGQSGLELARKFQPDLVILDLMLPGMDGMEVAARLRQDSDVYILMLTARSEEADRVAGLRIGADDYLTKPFSPREVIARARALLRRASGALVPAHVLRGGPVVVDVERHSVQVNGQDADLTPMEFQLLVALMRHVGRPLTRAQLLDAAQGSAFEGYERTIDAHIKNLRRKIEPDPAHPASIVTVFGVGYKFREGE